MSITAEDSRGRLRVLIAGGGVAALETLLALGELAPGRIAATVLAPNAELIDRPMTVREPFAYAPAARYPLAPIVADAGAELVAGELAWVDPLARVAHTARGEQIGYDALVLALGAKIRPRYEHAITIDDRHLDETLTGLVQDVECGYVKSVAFVSPGRMAWPLPLYELALMTAGRAYDMDVELSITIVTPEDSPLAIFGATASSAIAELLAKANVHTICSAYAEMTHVGEIAISPGERSLKADRVVALPELYGPEIHGVPLGEHGFIPIDPYGRVLHLDRVFAAGDATDFAIKHGGVACQQADTVAESIAALAGAALVPRPFHPVIEGILLTDAEPRYLTARITGGHGFSSEITDVAPASTSKIASRYLAPYLEHALRAGAPAQPTPV